MADQETMRGIARKAARAYARKCWWADPDDLEQEAWVAILAAEQTFDPSRARTSDLAEAEKRYLWRAAIQWLKGWLLRQRAPVHASKEVLNRLKGTPAMDNPVRFGQGLDPACGRERADDALARLRADAAIGGALKGAVRDFAERLWLECSLREADPVATGALLGLAPSDLHNARRRVAERLRKDRSLRDLL